MKDDPVSLMKYMRIRDARIQKKYPFYISPPLMAAFDELKSTGRVVVGGRATCGNKVDPSWVVLTSWNEVVAKANKLGVKIECRKIKQNNKSPTTCGGWWHENEYLISESAI